MDGGDFVAGFVLFSGAAFVLLMIFTFVKHSSAQKKNLDALFASGFKASHRVGIGFEVALFDDQRKEMVIVSGELVHRYNYDQISTWSHEYTLKNSRQRDHKLVITVLDTDNPRHAIAVSGDTARLWVPKLTAILAKK